MTALKEIDYGELQSLYHENNIVVALAHTPTCGTCIVAKKMLIIINETLKNIPIVQINLNRNEKMAIDYEILSVPCILIYKNHQCIEKIYAFESIPYLYKKITSYL